MEAFYRAAAGTHTPTNGGELLRGNRHRSFASISIDSRAIAARDVFVAIRGEVHDGHSFIAEVLKGGVRGVVIHRPPPRDVQALMALPGDVVWVAGADTTRALGDLGAVQRQRSSADVVAITGSNGKTSTRRMTAAIASRRFTGRPLRGCCLLHGIAGG